MKRLFKRLLLTLGALLAISVVGSVVLYFQYGKDLYVPPAAPATEIVVHGGTLFNGTSSAPKPIPGILIRGGRIVCVATDSEAGVDAVELDATGLAVVPGLIDLHVHFLANTADNADLPLPRLI